MKKEIKGVFYAYSFNGLKLKFVVYNNAIDCPSLHLKGYHRMELKPRFCLMGNDKYYVYKGISSNEPNESELIGKYDIEEDLFSYLKDKRMILYSNDMAHLYGFPDVNGYDSKKGYYGVGSPYKWAKKKGPILVKQKKGQFN